MDQIKSCRICGNSNLPAVLDLGEQMLTGVFPKQPQAKITSGPLRLVKCQGTDACGLVQLDRSYDFGAMYGENYGYRSGLNQSMVEHLKRHVDRISQAVTLAPSDLILDIGSNDSTTLQQYRVPGVELVGIDPTGVKFHNYYPSHIKLIPKFFSGQLFEEHFPGRKAKVITSFSMFYDLEQPLAVMRDVYNILADDGIWVFEQSYLPTMLSMNSYDTVCHEHLEYYALRQIKWMTDQVGFIITDVQFNDVNGGSFCVSVKKSSSGTREAQAVAEVTEREIADGINTLEVYRQFASRVLEAKKQLLDFVAKAKSKNKKLMGLGASTKGNVVLQYCGLTSADISCIGEVNVEKYGCYTPGTDIPIVREEEVLRARPDYLIVLPWHFKKFFLSAKKFSGHTMVFPLPKLEVVRNQ